MLQGSQNGTQAGHGGLTEIKPGGRSLNGQRVTTTKLTLEQTRSGTREDIDMPRVRPGRRFFTAGGTPIVRLSERERLVKEARVAIQQGRMDTPDRVGHAINHMTIGLKSGRVGQCSVCHNVLREDERCPRGCDNRCGTE